MTKHAPTQSHNYIPLVEKFIQSKQVTPAAINHIVVEHDKWCDVYKGHFCNCHPNVRLSRDEQ